MLPIQMSGRMHRIQLNNAKFKIYIGDCSMEMKKRALVSVSDKAGVVDFCKGLVDCGFEIIF